LKISETDRRMSWSTRAGFIFFWFFRFMAINSENPV
jgi:hypothetical protein